MTFMNIAVATDSENGEVLYAVGADGNIYERTQAHYGPGGSYDGKSITRGHAYTSPFWSKINLPFSEPALEEKVLQRLEFEEEA